MKRIEMSLMERNMLKANKRLVDKNNELLKDLWLLVRYIKGENQLKREVESIIGYYEKISVYKKRDIYD